MNTPFHEETLPSITKSEEDNIVNVYFCDMHNGCIQEVDTYRPKFSLYRKCRLHGCRVNDVTRTPLGRAYREVVHPYRRKNV